MIFKESEQLGHGAQTWRAISAIAIGQYCCLPFSRAVLAIAPMTLFPIFALMLAPNPPLPLSDTQMRDIGCVAAIGIIAHEQRSGQGASQSYPDMRESGKRWAGIVGDRVMEESGQPREVVAFAIKQAVEAEQEQAMKIGQTLPLMCKRALGSASRLWMHSLVRRMRQ